MHNVQLGFIEKMKYNKTLKQSVPVLLILLIVLIYIALVLFSAAKGPSLMQDDHWYMNDLRNFIETGQMHTNQVYPEMLAHNYSNFTRVLHNLPLMYPVIPFVILFGPYWGWIIANIIYSLLTCLILALLIRFLKGSVWQCFVFTAMFLMWIMTVHVSSHPIAEAGVVFYLAVLAWIFVKMPEGIGKSSVLGILMAVIVLNRVSFLVMAILLAGYIFFAQSKNLKQKLIQTVTFICSFLVAAYIGHYLLPMVSLRPDVCLKAPPNQAMLHFYQLHEQHFSASTFVSKALDSIRLQLLGRNILHTVFVTMFNILTGCFLLFAFRTKDEMRKRYSLITLFYVLVYITTIVWFQYQTRFLHTVMPFLLIWLVLMMPQIRKKWISDIIVISFCIINLSGNIINCIQNRKDAILSGQVESAYIQVREKINPQGPVLTEGNNKLLPWVFCRNPQLLMCDSKVNTTQELLWMRTKIPYEWIICEKESGLIDSLSSLKPKLIMDLSYPMSEFSLFKLISDNIKE